MSNAAPHPRSLPPGPPGAGRQLAALVAKELALEGRARLRINALLPFALLVLLLFSFAVGPQPALLRRLTPGFLWLALLFSSVLSLGQAQAAECQHDAQEGLLLLGVDPWVLYGAKALANAGFIALLGLVLVPVAMALYGTEIAGGPATLTLVLLMGSGAIAAPGTLFAALTAQARGQDVLLPLLLFPVLVPGLLAATRATALVMLGDPMHELLGWLALLGLFNLVYGLLCMVLYERVVSA